MEKKDSLLKKVLYTGIGIASLTKDKLESVVNDLIKNQKISSEEGKKVVDEFLNNLDSKKDELEAQMLDFIEKTSLKLKLTKKSEVDELEKRIADLESILLEDKIIEKE